LVVECDHTPYTFIPPKRLDDPLSSFMHRLIEVLHPVCQRRRCILANKVLATRKRKGRKEGRMEGWKD
jgi:hypothetical protein